MDMQNKYKNNLIDNNRIDVIPGIRVLAIFLIAWFHIWQQSWLTPYIFTKWGTIDLMFLPRAGYLWVDMFILLSAYQLFLPYVKKMMDGEELPKAKEFYKKRAIRIMPSYYFCILVCLLISLAQNEYSSLKYLLLDVFTHLTFTYVFDMYTYLWTNLNVVLWTVAILMQFYLIFPLLAKAFSKKPILAFGTMVSLAVIYRRILVVDVASPSMFINQLPSFLDVIAIGFFAAYLTIYIYRKLEYYKHGKGFVLISILSFAWIFRLMQLISGQIGHESIQRWQGENRLQLAIAFAVLLLSTAFASKWYRKIFSNKVMIFLGSVAYNYYIWHQYIAVRLKQLKIPNYVNEMPQMAAEKPWQYTYTALSFILPLLVAIALTWAIDRQIVPAMAKMIKRSREKVIEYTNDK